ncbi:MAG: hypothetical protein SOV16_00835 [Anaerobiospirillum succiniciproducens]|uniref:hypothetical protein n=1 Tax=Anaerobiospirillum succiniciproducens TaxID=13335 RepID=UPI002A747D07|nr:hypothetical protein [Anaerobiospirillum succiniciproducens]MDY2797722.1 hypothetical protein [Anaerobiospirillum succiniciproducens]
MKQTNNAIKFLMAQYRAIFKNANIAMAIAAATAALAAGQAQAASPDNGDYWINLSGSSTLNEEKTIEANGEKKAKETFDITVGEKGTLNIGGNASGLGNFNLTDTKTGIIKVEGGNVVIGRGRPSGAAVTLTEFDVKSGTAHVGGATAGESSLTADTIVIGTKPASSETPDTSAKAAAAATATFTIGQSGALVSSGDLTVYDKGEIKFLQAATAANSKITAKNGINLNGGAISVDNSGNGTLESAITSNGGSINVGTDGNNYTSLTVKANVTFTGEGGALNIKEKGKLSVTHATEDVSLDLGKATVSNAGTIDFGTVATKKTATLKLSTEQFDKVFAGKVEATGAADDSTLALDIQGSGDISLDKIIKSGDGTLETTKLEINSGGYSVKAANANATFTGDKLAAGKVDLTVGSLTVGSGKDFSIEAGKVGVGSLLTVSGSKALTVKGGAELNLDGKGSVDSTKITLGESGNSAGTLNVKGGDWSVKSLELVSGGKALVSGGSTLTVTGDLVTADNALIQVQNASTLDTTGASKLTLKSGSTTKQTLDIAGGSTLKVNQKDFFKVKDDNTVELVTADSKGSGSVVDKQSIKTDATSSVEFKVEESFTLNEKQLESLLGQFTSGDAGLKGFVSFGNNFKLEGLGETIELNKVKENADVYDGIAATSTDGKIKNNVMIGSLKVTTDDGKVDVAANKTAVLYKADANGNLVSNNKGTADVSLGEGSTLTLAGNGKAGAIEAGTANKGTIAFGHSKASGTVEAKSIGAKTAVASVKVNAGNVVLTAAPGVDNAPVMLQTQSLSLAKGTSLTAKDQDVVISAAAPTGAADLSGNLTAKSLTLNSVSNTNNSFQIADEAVVKVDALTMDESGSLFVGQNTDTAKSSATLEVKTLKLGGGTLVVDPDMQQKAAIAAVKSFSQSDTNGDAIVDGKIAVGMNSAVGIGYESRAAVEAFLTESGLMSDGKFLNGPDDVKGALVLNQPIKVTDGNGILIDTSQKDADLKNGVSGNKLIMANNAALIIDDGVFARGADGQLTGTAITIAEGAADYVDVDGTSKVVFAGDFDAADTGVKVFKGRDGTASLKGEVNFVSANGILSGKIGTDGSVASITPETTKLAGMFTTVSEPVRQLLKDRIVDAKTFDKAQLGAQFLGSVANDRTDLSGVKADAAAHAATYAGAQQAAVASVTTMADAMFGRVGAVGVEAASITATGSQANGGVWLTPMYKSVDADGFNAQGASYGSEVDLAGVAFGTDTVNGNMRFGAVFNIGSGDADGKGNGNGLKDEFDYYGFGIYSAMGFGNFALVGDASLTVISHDVKGFDLHGKADTKAVTMGLTGQYTFATPAVDVTPHLGARFVRLDTESYDLNSAKGTIAITAFDVQNVFSVPVGVTLSKDFVAGGWSLAPNADLTVTFNSGDTEAKSTTTFTGARAIDLNSEVMDEVTYGVTLGLGAQYGAFGTSFGINYTGSENTDAFGVNAQCRYMF